MKKLIALTVLLLTAIVLITLLYFKNLNIPGKDTARALQSIPADAALVLNFRNDDSFYDIYDSSALFTSIAGTEQLHELNLLRHHILQQPTLKPWFAGQPVYVSVHADGSLLLTMQAGKDFNLSSLTGAVKQSAGQVQIKPINYYKIKGVELRLPEVDSSFTLIECGSHIYSGSFSQALIHRIAGQPARAVTNHFAMLNTQLQDNALANLYVNYGNLSPLLKHWYKNNNSSFVRLLETLPAKAALTLNYKKDALMFSGYSTFTPAVPATYLSLFKNQQPYPTQLENIFPLITAYSTCFSASSPAQFLQDLSAWQAKAGLSQERQQLLLKIKAETGVDIATEFSHSLSHEFATLTTRFDEQLAIIQIKNGQALRPVLDNISTPGADSATNRFNYTKLPYLLLGDAFSAFRQPYYTVLDNYLILANSPAALNNYRRIYNNQTFLSKSAKFNDFDNLLAERCNVSFFVHYKNASGISKRNLEKGAYNVLYPRQNDVAGYYAGAYQLSSADHQFYTNFCMQLNRPDVVD